jgi:hypothetical protein
MGAGVEGHEAEPIPPSLVFAREIALEDERAAPGDE